MPPKVAKRKTAEPYPTQKPTPTQKLITPHSSNGMMNMHQQATTSTNTFNFPTYNKYTALSEEEDSDNDSEHTMCSAGSKKMKFTKTKTSTPANQAPTQQHKPPPLTIPSLPQHEVRKFLDGMTNDENKYEIRHSPDGTKIFPSNNAAFNAVKNKLVANKMSFFTHLLRDEQTTKFVLHGFYPCDVNELKKMLNEMKIMPAKISKLNVRNKRYDDHAVYLIHFLKKDQMKIATLRESARVIEYVRVRWEYYENKKKGPIQCSRCMQYGHGGNCCNLKPKCIRCGQEHISSECPHINPDTKRIPDEIVKCGLCGQNHPANFSGCEKRLAFIQRQNLYRSRTQRSQRPQATQARQFVHASQLDTANFPSINPTNPIAWTSPANPQQFNQNQHQAENSSELFTTAELITIMRDMMGRLRQCVTKEQQVFAISEICITYLYGST